MRKFLLFVISLVAFSGISCAQDAKGVKWEDKSFKEVLKMAAEDENGRNLVFLDCYASWCGPCKYMASKVFTTEAAGNYFNANFINMKLDMEKGEGIDVADTYKIRLYPTFLILDPKGKELGRIEGGDEVEAFIQKVKNAVAKIEK